MQNQTPSIMTPALIAGVLFGIIGGIPVLHLGCCLWALGAGLFATYLYSRRAKTADELFSAKKGAVVGLVGGGIFGFVAGSVHSFILNFLGALDAEVIADQVAQNPMIAPEDFEQVNQILQSTGPLLFVLVFIFLWLITGLIFGTLGGLIGGSVFKHEPEAVTDTAPPPPPIG